MSYRRARGAWLRLVFHRPTAFVLGAILLGAAGTLWVIERSWESWLTDGLTLVMGATGIALLAMAMGGRRPDWIEEDEQQQGQP